MNWGQWNTGSTTWPNGPLRPCEVLYEFYGPAIFTTVIGLEDFLLYKSDEHVNGDYYIAVHISEEEVTALKDGVVSLRGIFSKEKCWLLDVDFNMNVTRFERKNVSYIQTALPKSGVPLYSSQKRCPDSILQALSPFSFKFFGDDLLGGCMSFSRFNVLINNVYDLVRKTLIPQNIHEANSSSIMDFPIRQPIFASLLVPVERPIVDAVALTKKEAIKNLNPNDIINESERLGSNFVDVAEKTVERIAAKKLNSGYAKEHFLFFDAVDEIMPSEHSSVSKLQISSNILGRHSFLEVNREMGEEIRYLYREIRDENISVNGSVVGLVQKSKTFIIKASNGREVTCKVIPEIYDRMIREGYITVGRKVSVNGTYQKRSNRDFIKVDGEPKF